MLQDTFKSSKGKSPCILYKDIGKTATDVLKDDYDFGRKLKVKTKTSNGMTFTTEGSMAGPSNKAILAKLSGSYNHSSTGINISKFQVTTHGRLVAEGSLTNALLQGLKLTVKTEDGTLKNASGVKYKSVGKIGAEYRLDKVSTTADVDFSNNAVAGTAVFSHENFIIGAQAAVSVEKSQVSDTNVAMAYAGKDFHASVLTTKSMSKVMASIDHKPKDNLIYSVVLDHDLKSRVNMMTIGTRFKADSDTTYCGKINSDGFVSLALVQKLKPKVTLTTSAHLDAKNIEGESHKFGMGLTLG